MPAAPEQVPGILEGTGNMSNTTFQDAIKAYTGHAPELIIADGALHRFSTSDKASDQAGWYVLHEDAGGFQAGAFGDWRQDISSTWCNKSENDLTARQRKELCRRMEEAKAAARQAREDAQRAAAEKARRIWGEAADAPESHPYLVKKGITPEGIRQANYQGELCLVVPIRKGSDLVSLQFITPDGGKRFLKDGQKAGGFCLLGDVSRTLVICEGYATGRTIREATGFAVAVAFDCGNLLPVAQWAQRSHPGVALIIAADNDHKTESNPGKSKGSRAAEAVNGRMLCPPDEEGVTDFNDLAAKHGLDAVRNILTQHDGRPWAGCIVPSGYSLDKSGVSVLDPAMEKDPERLTRAPCWVSALSRSSKGGLNWGRLVHWFDADGVEHSRAIPASYFHSQSTDLACMLANEGLPVITGKEKKLIAYLSSFNPSARLISAPATGWKDGCFVLPDQSINEPEGERVVYQPEESDAAGVAIHGKGTLEEWKATVAACADLPLSRFVIAAAFAAPMRYHADVDAGGFHFYGKTSRGKTTLLQAACSVWGNAADPGMCSGDGAYLQRWNATKNGLEAIAAGFNDLPLCIDEIGESESRNFGGIIYNLMSGTGKARMTKTIGKRSVKAWRVLVLSSGELKVSDYISESGGAMRGGQAIRLVDIPAADLFRDATHADTMKQHCRNYYGTAGAAFLGRESIVERFREVWKGFDRSQIGQTNTPEAGRVLRRFALVACAGELAIECGVLPWPAGACVEASKTAFELWANDGGTMTEAEKGVESVRAFILKHDAAFEREQARENTLPRERAGWCKGGFYHFTPEAFKEACGGVNFKSVACELRSRDLLKTCAERSLFNRIKPLELGERVKVYSVASGIVQG